MNYNIIYKIIYILIIIIILSFILYYNYVDNINKKTFDKDYNEMENININNIHNISSNLINNNDVSDIMINNDKIVKHIVQNDYDILSNLNNKLSSNLDIDKNNIYNELNGNINSNISKLEDYSNKYNNLYNNSINNSSNINEYNNNLTTIDTNLKNYFNFMENNEKIPGKILDHQFNTNSKKNINLDVKTNILNNLIIKSVNNDNLKICENNEKKYRNCINLSIDNDVFNIRPENNTNGLYIRKPDHVSTLLHLDMLNNFIYLGGEDNKSPFMIKNNNTYIKDLKTDNIKLNNILL